MDSKILNKIIANHAYPDEMSQVQLLETHISWVLLTQNFAFKIKKPIQYSFLSFTSLESRKYYCEKEVELNRRLTQGMYLDVVPIRRKGDEWSIGCEKGEIEDYAVKMRKIDNARRMDCLLQNGRVTKDQIKGIAEILADFHKNAEQISGEKLTYTLWLDFADILKVKSFLQELLKGNTAEYLDQSVAFVKKLINALEPRIHERHESGFTVDGHGDLHSRNIFLLEQPVIFDCIEFNDHFRHVDILDELAFFCMDLESFGYDDLSRFFIEKYQLLNPCLLNESDQLLFLYYKLYRANVRLKVKALKAMQCNEDDTLEEIIQYFELFKRYNKELENKAQSML